jgi:hypothetical protein
MGMGTGGQIQWGRMGMGTNTAGTDGDGDKWNLRGWGWGHMGVPVSLSMLLKIVADVISINCDCNLGKEFHNVADII